MENENDQIADETAEVEAEEPEEPEKPEKPELTLEQKRGILKRKLTKINKELGITEEEPLKEKKTEKKTDELDLMQLAYLESKGIETDEEINFIKGVMKRSGEDVRTVLKDEFVKNRLASIKNAKAVLDATPEGTKSSPQSSAKDTVDYWLAKKELPKDNPELAIKVVNARIAKEKGNQKFYNS